MNLKGPVISVLTQGPEGPAPVTDIVAVVYKESSALYVEPLPPQPLNCLGPLPTGEVGCPVARVWYGLANITPQQEADAEWLYSGPDLERNWVLVVGHFATVTVRDHRFGDDPVEQIWFIVSKLYLTPPPRTCHRAPLESVLLHHGNHEQRPGLGDQPWRAVAARREYHVDRHGHIQGQHRPEQRRRHVRDGGGRLHALSPAHQGRRVLRPAN